MAAVLLNRWSWPTFIHALIIGCLDELKWAEINQSAVINSLEDYLLNKVHNVALFCFIRLSCPTLSFTNFRQTEWTRVVASVAYVTIYDPEAFSLILKEKGNYEFNPSKNINLRWCNITFLRSNGDILSRNRFVKNMALWWQVITNQTEDVSVADLISGREVMEELGNEIMIPNRRSSFNSRIG